MVSRAANCTSDDGPRLGKQISSYAVSGITDARELVQRHTLNIYDTVFTRRISIYFTLTLARLGVTANQVSGFGAIVGGVSCVLMTFGSPGMLLVGVGLLHLYTVLDSVDGELARLSRRFSLLGLFMEDLSAYIMINAFNLAVAWRLYASANLAWPLVAAVSVTAFGRNVMPVARRAMLKSIMTRRPVHEMTQDPVSDPPSVVREFVYENVIHVTNHWVVVSALLALYTYEIISAQIVAVVFVSTLALHAARELFSLGRFLSADRLDRELSRIYRAASLPADADGRQLSDYSAL